MSIGQEFILLEIIAMIITMIAVMIYENIEYRKIKKQKRRLEIQRKWKLAEAQVEIDDLKYKINKAKRIFNMV